MNTVFGMLSRGYLIQFYYKSMILLYNMLHDAPELIPPGRQNCKVSTSVTFSPYDLLGLGNAVSIVVTNSPDLLRISRLNSTPRPFRPDLAVSLVIIVSNCRGNPPFASHYSDIQCLQSGMI